MTIFRRNTYGKDEVAHSILIEVVDKDKNSGECETKVCLGDGSLRIVVDGYEILHPGDYPLQNVGGRIVAHNTYSACSRKWYDFDKVSADRQLSISKTPLDYIIEG